METPIYELYCEDFSEKGWKCLEADEIPGDTIWVNHEDLRIIDENDLQNFLLDKALTSNSFDDAVKEKLSTMDSDNVFEFKGDGDGLGFILDIWENQKEMDSEEPIHSYQFWFDDYDD
jgi:hypothetical protein